MPLTLVQALELAQVVEAEARWENLRKHRFVNQGRNPTDNLIAAQKAYDAFHTRLVAYNRQHRPEHVPELLLNTAVRLGRWCTDMSDLFGMVGADAKAACPVNLVEKAYRRAENIAGRLREDPPSRRTPPQMIDAAIVDLQTVAAWCNKLVGAHA